MEQSLLVFDMRAWRVRLRAYLPDQWLESTRGFGWLRSVSHESKRGVRVARRYERHDGKKLQATIAMRHTRY